VIEAFAPGRVNLIGEHTDYNGGLALPFAIERGVTVTAERVPGDEVLVESAGFGRDRFSATDPAGADGWRAFARGVVAGLGGVPGCRVEVTSDLPAGSGLSSSAALSVALALAFEALRGEAGQREPLELARLCSRVENEWVGAPTGLLDQLAVLHGGAVLIDFESLEVDPIPLALSDWTLAVTDSGAPRALASSGYAERRAECEEVRRLLGAESLSAVSTEDLGSLPPILARRARHVLDENDRVRAVAASLKEGDVAALGPLLDASHESLRDLYECSTSEVETTVAWMKACGAGGARMVGGGFGGHVLGLFGPGLAAPAGALVVGPGSGAS
jgi:galactokinase